jgi:hypothetical protein
LIVIDVYLKTSPPAPLLNKERGDKAQLYWGEVKLYLGLLVEMLRHFISSYFLLLTSYLFFLRKVTNENY